MKCWQEDLWGSLGSLGAVGERGAQTQSEQAVFQKLVVASQCLGFGYCAYGLRIPFPFSNPKTLVLSNYPAAWQQRYADQGYLAVDPTVLHGRRSQTPLVWSDAVFATTPGFWDEAQSFGLSVGWAQSTQDVGGGFGMLSLARTGEPLGAAELAAKQADMRWLAQVAHMALSPLLMGRLRTENGARLTAREVEVLKWTADGKTASEISDLLVVSENTVNFHVKNAVGKLQTSNKTAAVVRAAMLGLLG